MESRCLRRCFCLEAFGRKSGAVAAVSAAAGSPDPAAPATRRVSNLGIASRWADLETFGRRSGAVGRQPTHGLWPLLGPRHSKRPRSRPPEHRKRTRTFARQNMRAKNAFGGWLRLDDLAVSRAILMTSNRAAHTIRQGMQGVSPSFPAIRLDVKTCGKRRDAL